jgi:4-hydroxyphenylpyruvate dioxygenase-like putative hemolysin
MGTDGFEFVEYIGPTRRPLAALFEGMGFVAAPSLEERAPL